MVKVINDYETVFIIDPNLDEDDTKGVIEKFKSLIESTGKIESIDEWGKRRLAYEINGYKEGYYVVVNFSAESSFPKELERNFKISDSIVRYIVIKKEK